MIDAGQQTQGEGLSVRNTRTIKQRDRTQELASRVCLKLASGDEKRKIDMNQASAPRAAWN